MAIRVPVLFLLSIFLFLLIASIGELSSKSGELLGIPGSFHVQGESSQSFLKVCVQEALPLTAPRPGGDSGTRPRGAGAGGHGRGRANPQGACHLRNRLNGFRVRADLSRRSAHLLGAERIGGQVVQALLERHI